MDDRNDAKFYQSARMVQHLDSTTIAHITALYGRVINPDMRVVDLMSSWVSHLSATMELHVTGLGMNK